MHWTEQAIKSCLDGTFTKFKFNGGRGARVVTEDVHRDWIPEYTAAPEQKQAASTKGVARKPWTPWTPEHDAMLVELRRAGVSLNACTGILQRGVKAVRQRAQLLLSQEV